MPKFIFDSLKRHNYAGVSLTESNHFTVRRAAINKYRIISKARIPCFFPHNDTTHVLTFYIVSRDLDQIIIGNDSRYKIQDTHVKFYHRWKRVKELGADSSRDA